MSLSPQERETKRRWYERNKDKARASANKWKAKNKGKVRAQKERWKDKHGDSVQSLNRGYARAHRERHAVRPLAPYRPIAERPEPAPVSPEERKARQDAALAMLRDPDSAKDILARVKGLVPKSAHDDMRLDLCSDVILALMEGDIAAEEIPGFIPHYSLRARKMLSTCGNYRNQISLDDPVPNSHGLLTFKDVLPSDVMHF